MAKGRRPKGGEQKERRRPKGGVATGLIYKAFPSFFLPEIFD